MSVGEREREISRQLCSTVRLVFIMSKIDGQIKICIKAFHWITESR